ncbi:MAG TPA: beta-ketoacyl synthase N-terminal-like domain-containing protein, partial [Chloroflexia bacterium]
MGKAGKRVAGVSSAKLAQKVQQVRSRVAGIDLLNTEPVAVVGMGCRFPGGADNPEAFWRLLRDGVDAITEVPPTRWSLDDLYDPNPDHPEKMYTRWGGFVEPVGGFDPAFFGIAPREAASMDPQQRLLLEVSWEALENAGYAVSKLAGSPTGVFIGISTNDYTHFHLRTSGWLGIDAYTGTGNAHSVASGRLSYLFGLQGPSLAVDTACSSSLVALHLACQSLRARECSLALAGGVNLMLSPEVTMSFCKARMMAPDGRCKTFDSAADGYVRGEGCGIVVLKRLSDALRDEDNILAVVRGSAVNQDGRTSGLTAPSSLAQQSVIRQALANAQVEPDQVSYIEAHGTGTLLGDPIEARALGELFGATRHKDQALAVGSVKTNIGHLEAAAGVAGLMKVILSLQHGEIPPHLHLKTINPYIPIGEMPLVIPTEVTPWSSGDTPRIAGVSAFAFSGTNAHVVVEEAPRRERPSAQVERPLHLLALSAKTEEALKELTTRFIEVLAAQPEQPLADICFTADTGRSHFPNRVVAVARSAEQMRDKLATFATGREAGGVVSGQAQSSDAPRVAFLFTGQGSQYAGMGRQLFETQPTFREAIERCDAIAAPYLERSLLTVLFPGPGTVSPIHETAYTQPALFALEYALAELWKSWGVTPAAVMGHSVGEYVAACVAGVLSVEDALKLLILRGKLMQALPRGAMAAVFADQARVIEAIAPYGDEISISAINGPENVVIAGEEETLQTALQALADMGIGTQQLTVSHAFHSRMIEPMLEAFEKAASEVRYSDPQVAFISNLTGQLADASLICNAQYWRRHTREPVRFADGMQTLHANGYELFLELGPRPSLLGMGRRCIPENKGTWLPSLRGEGDEWSQLLKSLSALYISGVRIDWDGFDKDYPRQRVALPTYPFQRKAHWFDVSDRSQQPKGAHTRGGRNGAKVHPLLGHKLPSALKEIQFECELNASSLPFIEDHKIGGLTVLPAAAYLEMALAAAAYAGGPGAYAVEQTDIREALLFQEGAYRVLQFVLSPQGNKTGAWQVFSLAEGGTDKQDTWKLHAEGVVCPHEIGDADTREGAQLLDDVRQRCTEELPVDEYYEQLREHGLDYGESLRGIKRIWRGDMEALGQVQLAGEASTEESPYQIHPALLDSCFQLLAAALPEGVQDDATVTYVPVGLGHLHTYGKVGSEVVCHVTLKPDEGAQPELATGDLRLFDADGQVVADISKLNLKRVDLG